MPAADLRTSVRSEIPCDADTSCPASVTPEVQEDVRASSPHLLALFFSDDMPTCIHTAKNHSRPDKGAGVVDRTTKSDREPAALLARTKRKSATGV